ncbi:hypothetical protein WSM22_26550 [Cytophagales bacterium WSM2-2]|nr:hypothetical protein WSM22_26550 [Cytophagales bacterium WSM2-2]
MQQPELARRLTALRKEKTFTQDELAEKSRVSVRTIQRIEAGEVMPRMFTIKILLETLGQDFETFSNQFKSTMETKAQISNRNPLLISVFAGAIYLAAQILLGAMDIAWLTKDRPWEGWVNQIYIGLSLLLCIAYLLFMRGFIILGGVFGNNLLKIGGYVMIMGIIGASFLDISTLSTEDVETLELPYSTASVFLGALSILFGIALVRLQDGMGELARAAGVMEIVIGCSFVTVLFFFIGYVVMVPAVVVEIIVLFRAYEYLSRSEPTGIAPVA